MPERSPGANLISARMMVTLVLYRSSRAIWSFSSGTTKFPAVMTMDGRYWMIKPRTPSCPLLSCEQRERERDLKTKRKQEKNINHHWD